MKKSSSKYLTIALALSMARRNWLNTLTATLRHWVYAIPPLSSKPRASRMVFQGIMCFALVGNLMSCRSHEHCSTVVQNGSELFNVVRSVDTVVVRDSVFVREVMKGDTVYLTRTEYRDRWRVRVVHDTVRDTQYITQTIEHPPERYVPKFYRWSAAALYILLGIIILLKLLKYRLKIW